MKEGGVIVRTAAEGASAEDVERDLVFLQRLWKTIQARAKGAAAPSLVYQEAELPLRIVRDLFAGDFVSAQVDNERTHKRIVSYLKKTSPHMIERVHRYKEKESLFESSGVEKEIASTLDRRVDLPSGGYLVFDYAEAFTVIDVNTGRFVGSRSKNSNQRLEDTITKNNLEAVKEVVRQLRLRDIGGIIVIDFIDMANPKNRASVEDALRDELERDRTKTYVVEISPLGLVEMTRQNVTDGPREILTRKCPTCAGDGIVVSDHTVAMQVERKLRALAAPGQPRPGLPGRAAPARARARRRPGRRPTRRDRGGDAPSLLPRRRPRGTSTPITSRSSPRASSSTCSPPSTLVEGATVEIKLGEVGRYDATAGAGKLDGARGSRRRRRQARRQEGDRDDRRVLDGQAFATLVTAGGGRRARSRSRARPRSRRGPRPSARRPPPRTATRSSLAERRRRRAADDAPTARRRGSGRRRREDADDARSRPTTIEADAETRRGQAEDGVAPAKKRTRRGSRGGRRRRKPAGAAAAPMATAEHGERRVGRRAGRARRPPRSPDRADADAERRPVTRDAPKAPSRRRAPRIHVPGDPRGGAVARGRRGARSSAATIAAATPTVERRRRTPDEPTATAAGAPTTVTRRPSSSARRVAAAEAARTTARSRRRRETRSRAATARRTAAVELDGDGSAAGRGDAADRRRGRRAPRRRVAGRRRSPTSPSSRRRRRRPSRPSSGDAGLRADVRVARRLRPQMMRRVRYTPSARGRLPAFSASETHLA